MAYVHKSEIHVAESMLVFSDAQKSPDFLQGAIACRVSPECLFVWPSLRSTVWIIGKLLGVTETIQ